MEDFEEGMMRDILEEKFNFIKSKRPNDYKIILGLFYKLVTNIIGGEENKKKFGKINKSNPLISSKILSIPELEECFCVLGFEEGTGENDNYLVYNSENERTLTLCCEILQNLLNDAFN